MVFSKWGKDGSEARECLTADTLEFAAKIQLGSQVQITLLLKKETDSSWKANEHVSAIWKSHLKTLCILCAKTKELFYFMKIFFSAADEAENFSSFLSVTTKQI